MRFRDTGSLDFASSLPSIPDDIFSDDVRSDPFETYRKIRDAGPVCALAHHDVVAVARHAEVKAVLGNWRDFTSASGVTMNELMNEVTKGSLIASDPPDHTHLRKIMVRPLAPGKLTALKSQLAELARDKVAMLKGAGTVDIVDQLATLLPLKVVSELVGLPEEGREKMLEWAAAGFNGVARQGANAKSDAVFPILATMVEYLTDPSLPARLKPGSWAADLWASVEAGEIERADFAQVIQGYVTPSLDTTIFGLTNLIWLLASNPDQWSLLKKQPSMITRCINEALRLESPVLGFARVATCEVDVGGVALPKGTRLLTLLGAANRDDRRYENPDSFDIQRDASDHVAFGAGVHRCAGGNLAMLELMTVLEELVRQVDRFEIVSTVRSDSLGLRGIAKLEMVLH